MAWGAIACALYVVLARGKRPARWSRVACSVVVVGMLLMETMAPGVSWSPYYKVTTEDVGTADVGFLLIKANGVPHQLMAPAQWKLEQGERIYATPYLRLPDNALGDVLVVGAGSGSDVAIALREGARHVDAVDIDPRILEIGPSATSTSPTHNPGSTSTPTTAGPSWRAPTGRLRPDPVRAARLADPGERRLADPAGVVPVHRGGDGVGARPPQAGRRVRDVQLLPRELAGRPARRAPPPASSATRRASTRSAGRRP